jgi:hypothetical protein
VVGSVFVGISPDMNFKPGAAGNLTEFLQMHDRLGRYSSQSHRVDCVSA